MVVPGSSSPSSRPGAPCRRSLSTATGASDVRRAAAAGLTRKLGAQIPDGTVLGARGPFGPYAPNNRYNQWFLKGFEARYNAQPNYASYQMAQAILGVKLAWEKAQDANGGKRPTNEQVGAALE